MQFGESLKDIELSPHKYLLHADKLKVLAEGGDVFPVTVEIDPVDYCNHRCRWCVDPRHGKSSLRLDLAFELLDELRRLGVMGIVYKGGGEPTLHGEFPELLDCARRLGFEVGIVTNGSWLEALCGHIVSLASYLRVSIDGPTRESHKAAHGTDDFDRIVSGVAKVVEMRGRHRHPAIGLSFAMDWAVMHLIDEAVSLGERLGVDYVLFRTPFYDEVGRTPTMTIEQTRAVREAFKNARQGVRGSMQVFVDQWISNREASLIEGSAGISPRRGSFMAKEANGIEHVSGRCLASPLLAVVTADGTVYPCCNLRALDRWAIGVLDYGNGVDFRKIRESEHRHQIMSQIHQIRCIRHCTHPMSKYNEAIEYLSGPKHHGSFV